jgi:hypothetical protein
MGCSSRLWLGLWSTGAARGSVMNYRRAENLLRSVIPRRQGMRPAGCSEEASTPWLSREKLPPPQRMGFSRFGTACLCLILALAGMNIINSPYSPAADLGWKNCRTHSGAAQPWLPPRLGCRFTENPLYFASLASAHARWLVDCWQWLPALDFFFAPRQKY